MQRKRYNSNEHKYSLRKNYAASVDNPVNDKCPVKFSVSFRPFAVSLAAAFLRYNLSKIVPDTFIFCLGEDPWEFHLVYFMSMLCQNNCRVRKELLPITVGAEFIFSNSGILYETITCTDRGFDGEMKSNSSRIAYNRQELRHLPCSGMLQACTR